MSKAAEILAKVRDRKKRLHEQSAALSWEWWDHAASPTIFHPAEETSLSGDQAGARTASSALGLTAAERRRNRRLQRSEARDSLRQQAALGIIKPPPPKLSRKNVAAVYGAAYIKDPTRLEMVAQEAEEERKRQHEAANRQRQLSGRERWLKTRSKIETRRHASLHCAVYYRLHPFAAKDLSILDFAAKKYFVTGVCLFGDKGSFVLVEGGEPELAKIGKLASSKLELGLIWRGILPAQNFKHWSIHSTPEWSRILQAHGVDSLFQELPLGTAGHVV